MKSVSHLFVFLGLSFLCTESANAAVSKLDGVWQSEGYGYLFEIDGTEVSIYEHTTKSCLISGLSSGTLSYQTSSTVASSQKNNEELIGQFPVSIPGFIDADMEIYEINSLTSRLFHRNDTNTFFTANKIEKLPRACLEKNANQLDPLKVFKSNFELHYPFFKQKNVDWGNHIKSVSESDSALFSELTKLVSPFKDAHIAIVAPSINGYYFGNEEAAVASTPVPEANLLETIKIHDKKSVVASYCNEQLQFARIGKETAYLLVKSFNGYSAQGGYEADSRKLQQALRTIFKGSDFASLIIDVRNNIGGSDKLALQLATALSTNKYPAYAKQAIKDGRTMKWTEARTTWVAPESPALFDGEVILLTNRQTVSAGETFIMSMMERQPRVTRVGDYTKGSFSDMLPRTLPNGWLFGLPNERYLDRAGRSYDLTGITPHVRAIDTQQSDNALKAAVSLLANTEISRRD